MTDNQDYVLAYWVKQLSNVQLPVLSDTIRELNAVTQADNSGASQLSEVILKDSALTTKVLRVANSVYYHHNSDKPINTISRAVVQLGFRAIKAISLSVMMVDSLLEQDAKERMVEWMARAFHTGVQAKKLIRCVAGEQQAEEVFITALLLHLGELAFWAYNNDIVNKLDRLLEPHSTGDSEVERVVLGTTFKVITRILAKAWHLEEYLGEALDPGDHPSTVTAAVLLGEEVCMALEHGWNSQEFGEVVVKVSRFTGKNIDDARELIEQGAEEAAKVAVSYGANRICHFIPSILGAEKETEPAVLKPDLQLQLDILREMGAMVEETVDTTTLFQAVLEGVHRGVGLERVALCLVDRKTSVLTAKYVLGEGTEGWCADMQFPIDGDVDNLFSYCLLKRRNVWLQPDQSNTLQYLVKKKTERLVTSVNLLMAPVYAGDRAIGVLVADRGHKQTPIAQGQKESFDYFAQQLSMSLAMLAVKRDAATVR